MRTFCHPQARLTPRRRSRGGFSMAEMLIVMGIMTLLAASLVVLVPKLRTSAMCKQAAADIQQLSMKLFEYHEDTGRFPDKPYVFNDASGNPVNPQPATVGQADCIDYVLYNCLTNPAYGWDEVQKKYVTGTAQGWGMARNDWQFIRKEFKDANSFLDPWGVPYYYIPCTSYLLGVRVWDATDGTPAIGTVDGADKALPNCFGTSPARDDFKAGDNRFPPDSYYTMSAVLNVFFNPTTFQIHSKGPDQKTDYYSDATQDDANRALIDACDRGCDPDDITNFGGGNVGQ